MSNGYSYSLNNPIKWSDPNGEKALDEFNNNVGGSGGVIKGGSSVTLAGILSTIKASLLNGEKVAVKKFTKKGYVDGVKESVLIEPKSKWNLRKDRAGQKSHGGSYYKLYDKKGTRKATLTKDGTILRN